MTRVAAGADGTSATSGGAGMTGSHGWLGVAEPASTVARRRSARMTKAPIARFTTAASVSVARMPSAGSSTYPASAVPSTAPSVLSA